MLPGNTSGMANDGFMRRYPSNGVDYPLRFFNMLHFERPRTLAEIFKWCIVLDESHGLLNRITDTMARYPITHAIVTGDIGENTDDWAKWLNEKLRIMDELVCNGKDYYTFGNCLVSIVPPFKRYLVCPKCHTYKMHCINDDNSDEKPFKWKFHNYKFIAECHDKECKYNGIMEVKDEYLEGKDFLDKISIIRWPIANIKVRDLAIAGKKKIYYKIEEKYKKPIQKGDRFVVSNVPYTFILACKQNGNAPVIELPADMTFHYKHESVTEPEWEGLSKPSFFQLCSSRVFPLLFSPPVRDVFDRRYVFSHPCRVPEESRAAWFSQSCGACSSSSPSLLCSLLRPALQLVSLWERSLGVADSKG